MFLAFNEMRRQKLRYGLILGLLILIAYLMFFLTGLAYGLMQQNRSAVDKWEATSIYLTEEANSSLAASILDASALESVAASDKAFFAQKNLTAWTLADPSEDDKEKVSVFGIDPSQFLAPKLLEGAGLSQANDVIIAQPLAEALDLNVGDRLSLAGVDESLTIVGVTDDAYFSVAPVIYLSLADFNRLLLGNPEGTLRGNAVVTRGDSQSSDQQLMKLPIADFIEKLPGYRAQNLTFAFMIGFLIVIAAVVIGIFMYVLTIQKAPIFGVLKVQGISNAYIGASVLAQTALLALTGTLIGLLATLATASVLPQAVPFQVNAILYAGISLALVMFALFGSLFSVRSVVAIDPLKSIS